MKKTNELLLTSKNALRGIISAPVSVGAPSLSESDKALVNRLFGALSGIYARKWSLVFVSNEVLNTAKRQWTLTLLEHDIQTQQQIDQGLAVARRSMDEYPPKAAEFCWWCLGIDDEYLTVTYNRLMQRVKPQSKIEAYARKAVGSQCRRLERYQALKLWREQIIYFARLNQRGLLQDEPPAQRALPRANPFGVDTSSLGHRAQNLMRRMRRIQNEKAALK